MASSPAAAATSRAVRLSRLFASTSPSPSKHPSPSPTARSTKPSRPFASREAHKSFKAEKEEGTQKLRAGDAASNKNEGRKHREPVRVILKRIFQERDPDKLISEFIAASSKYRGFRGRRRVYEMAVSRLASAGRRDGVAAILEAQKPFLETSTENWEDFAVRLISLYGYASMPYDAAKVFGDLSPPRKTTVVFNSLLSALSKAGELEALATAFQKIPASCPSVVPNVDSYNILIRALCDKPDLSAAIDTVTLMEKRGVSPDIISFNSLLNGFYNNGLVDDAETVWEMMKERNMEPDTKSYNSKLRGLILKGKTADAVALVERMEKDGPEPEMVTYNELIRGYCKDGRLEEAKQLYDHLVKNEFLPNKGTYETFVPYLVQAGELDCAVKYCEEIFRRKFNVNPSTVQGVVNALVMATRVEEATRIFELGRKLNYYNRIKLIMPCAGEVNEAQAEINEEVSVSEEEEHEEEEESEK